jgi:hypothetical protein
MAKPTKSTQPRMTNAEMQRVVQAEIDKFFGAKPGEHVPTDHEITLLEEDLMEICTIQLRRTAG